jgi:hypothetical protein
MQFLGHTIPNAWGLGYLIEQARVGATRAGSRRPSDCRNLHLLAHGRKIFVILSGHKGAYFEYGIRTSRPGERLRHGISTEGRRPSSSERFCGASRRRSEAGCWGGGTGSASAGRKYRRDLTVEEAVCGIADHVRQLRLAREEKARRDSEFAVSAGPARTDRRDSRPDRVDERDNSDHARR